MRFIVVVRMVCVMDNTKKIESSVQAFEFTLWFTSQKYAIMILLSNSFPYKLRITWTLILSILKKFVGYGFSFARYRNSSVRDSPGFRSFVVMKKLCHDLFFCALADVAIVQKHKTKTAPQYAFRRSKWFYVPPSAARRVSLPQQPSGRKPQFPEWIAIGRLPVPDQRSKSWDLFLE